MKNGAELLDRLVKDIVSESASSYVSVLEPGDVDTPRDDTDAGQRAFKLPEFIPLLQERIFVLNPFTRTFLVSWITLLDSIPDLELVSFLPSFLGGLLKFLSDPNQDVHTTTKVALDRFLAEIKKISGIKRNIAESRRSHAESVRKPSDSSIASPLPPREHEASSTHADVGDPPTDDGAFQTGDDSGSAGSLSSTALDEQDADPEDEYIPGQDVLVDHAKILDILLNFLTSSSGKSFDDLIFSSLMCLQKRKFRRQLSDG